MKLKEFGPPGGRASKILLCRSATAVLNSEIGWGRGGGEMSREQGGEVVGGVA